MKAAAPRRAARPVPVLAVLSLVAPLALAACSSGDRASEGGRVSPGSSFEARVVSVTDGDTIKVKAAGIGVETIRLIGIDTPEVYGGVECGGREASNEMKRLASGRVTVRTDPTQDLRDRYGRLLAYVDRAGRDLGRTMVARGLAPSYVYDREFRRYPSYLAAENRARAARRGSWKRCNIGN
jgi:endonuclease YncB( thermonuclease family)